MYEILNLESFKELKASSVYDLLKDISNNLCTFDNEIDDSVHWLRKPRISNRIIGA